MPVPTMITPARRPAWDIFCNVIDNFGDIGVCWRLSRQLADEQGCSVRLWVNDLTAFRHIFPKIEPLVAVQRANGVEIRHWSADFADVVPGNVVIEGFACQLPECFIAAMARREVPPVWINLEYLSAEEWVSGCHALPSPHPKLPLTKYFFFPGFDDSTGGLLRERGLDDHRREFSASSERRSAFWRTLGFPPPQEDALLISLFAYENSSTGDLLDIWAHGQVPVCCLAPETRTLTALEAYARQALKAGDAIRAGKLELRVLPFVSQPDYDQLLWLSDINFVRGEDSFVRAQWAEKPLVWHIYPQDEGAHVNKLNAFLDRYTENTSRTAAGVFRELHLSWNSCGDKARITPELWQQWIDRRPELGELAVNWAKYLKKQEDLCSRLVRFCHSKL